jgi:hypothetical protein
MDVKILIVVVFVTQKKPSGKSLAIHQTTRYHNLKVPKLTYNTHFTCISNKLFFLKTHHTNNWHKTWSRDLTNVYAFRLKHFSMCEFCNEIEYNGKKSLLCAFPLQLSHIKAKYFSLGCSTVRRSTWPINVEKELPNKLRTVACSSAQGWYEEPCLVINAKPCGLIHINRCLGETCCLHFQGGRAHPFYLEDEDSRFLRNVGTYQTTRPSWRSL